MAARVLPESIIKDDVSSHCIANHDANGWHNKNPWKHKWLGLRSWVCIQKDGYINGDKYLTKACNEARDAHQVQIRLHSQQPQWSAIYRQAHPNNGPMLKYVHYKWRSNGPEEQTEKYHGAHHTHFGLIYAKFTLHVRKSCWNRTVIDIYENSYEKYVKKNQWSHGWRETEILDYLNSIDFVSIRCLCLCFIFACTASAFHDKFSIAIRTTSQ